MPYSTKKGTGKDKGKTCVHKKSSKKKVGCTSGPIEKYLTALRMAESDDMDWIKNTVNTKLAKNESWILVNDIDRESISEGHEIQKYLFDLGYDWNSGYFNSLSDFCIYTIYHYADTQREWDGGNKQIYYQDGCRASGVRISDIDIKSGKHMVYYWSELKPKSLNESEEDFNWASGFEWSKEMLGSMLTDCKPLRVANFNIRNNQPYSSAGGPSIMFLSRCKEWWDYFRAVPSTPSTFGARGPAEWFTEDNYDDGEYGVIWNPGWGRKKITPQLEDLKNGYTSAITIEWGYGIEKQLNGTGRSEAWFIVDEDNRPVYNLIPEPVKGYAKIYEEEFFGDKLNESEDGDWDWIKDIETKSFKKSKSYVVDVRHLRPDTSISISPTSPKYTDLTRADVLDKLKRLGYNDDDISLNDADYLYIEPNDEAGYWDDSVWVSQTHWIDYDMEHNTPDPTYNGKYEIMDVNDLMYLLDNKMISESNEFDWADEIPSDYYPPDVKDAIQKLQYWQGDAYQTDDEIGLSVQDVIDNPNKTNIQDLIDVLKHWKPYVDGDDVYWAVEDLISSINPERFKDLNNVYDHEIKFEKNSYGTRTHDGYVFRKNRRDDDDDIIKVIEENKKSITEAAGISFEARKWGEIIYNEIMDNPNEKKRLIIDGYDHPKAFNGFPIDYVVVDFYDRLTGYGQEHSGYDKDGNYVVLLYIQPRLVQGQGGYDLRSVLNHEMKHAWDDYNRLSKGLPSLDNTKETKELYNKDFILMLSDQNVRGPIKELLKYYYYLSKLETTAYMENVYDNNPVYERVVREIASKDFESFKDSFDLDINWHLMTTAYDIPFLKKFKSPVDFIDYSSEELRSRAIKVIKKINKMKYVHGKN